ncbi:MAG: UvrB/UvrC motif-containing protein [Puniceicoccales bacterium]|nr:UvrB/UvrC motif-containing protein [Puniceicoccales bacterium]
MERDMLAAADALEFERAALLRDQIEILKGNKPATSRASTSYSKKRRRR